MQPILSWRRWQNHAVFALIFALMWSLVSAGRASAAVSVVQLSTDPYTKRRNRGYLPGSHAHHGKWFDLMTMHRIDRLH